MRVLSWLNKKPKFLIPDEYPELGARLMPTPRYWVYIWIISNFFDFLLPDAIEDHWLVTVYIAGSVVAFFGGMAYDTIRWAKLIKKAKRYNRVLCTRCAYDMRDLRRAERCPECGKLWNRFEAKNKWRYLCYGERKSKKR